MYFLQNDEDKAASVRGYNSIGQYFHWKYEADKELYGRTIFKWTILRPGALLDDAGSGKVSVGRTHLKSIPVRYYKRDYVFVHSSNDT